MMTAPIRFGASCILFVAASGVAVSPQPAVQANADSSLPPLVQRFLDRQDEPVTSYRALRRLEAHNTRYKKHGWLEAWTTLDRERGFTFEIIGEGGSSYVRDKVLRKALQREAEAYARSETAGAAIAPANYRFADQGSNTAGLISVSLEPKRKDTLLVRGRIYLTADEGDLVRIEGQVAKAPSFWTRRVDIVRKYERIGGVRVPVATESTAQVLMAGHSTFLMQYEYASINGREVGQPKPRKESSGLSARAEK
jgi:hypothetical protein